MTQPMSRSRALASTAKSSGSPSFYGLKAAVERLAKNRGFKLTNIFEDQITAAKSGRPAFTEMLKALRAGHARGVIIHKIDRSARNLRDWSDLGELIDSGIEVHFANESLDLSSRAEDSAFAWSCIIQISIGSIQIRTLPFIVQRCQGGSISV